MRYPDGRIVCDHCHQYVIEDRDKVMAYYLRARQELAEFTGETIAGTPELKLVGLDEVQQHLSKLFGYQVKGTIRGYYFREELVDPQHPDHNILQGKTIFMLYGMKANHYLLTAVHESTHDLMAENYPQINQVAPAWLKEGVCQYTSFSIAWKYKLKTYFVEFIEHADPNYGGGFRYLLKRFGPGNWSRVALWLKSLDPAKLPATAPEVTAQEIWSLLRKYAAAKTN